MEHYASVSMKFLILVSRQKHNQKMTRPFPFRVQLHLQIAFIFGKLFSSMLCHSHMDFQNQDCTGVINVGLQFVFHDLVRIIDSVQFKTIKKI